MPKVSALTAMTAAEVTDRTAINLLVSDGQGALTSKKIALDEFGTLMGMPAGNAVVVIGTGVAATDTAAFAAAKTIVEANDSGVIYIQGKVSINSNQNFTKAISLLGVPGTAPEIELNDNVFISWNNGYTPLSASSTTITATTAFQPFLKVPTGTLTAGQWFFAIADDTIDGVTHSNDTLNLNLTGCTVDASTDKVTKTAHGLTNNTAVLFYDVGASSLTKGRTYWVVNKTTDDFQLSLTRAGSAIDITASGTVSLRSILANCPLEMHQVMEIRETSGGYDYIVFDDFIVDALTVNPRVVVCSSPTDGIDVKNLKFSWTGSTAPTNSCIAFNKCVNVSVDNCVWDYNGPNEIWVMYCAKVSVTNCKSQRNKAYNNGEGYFAAIGSCNGFLMSNCDSQTSRHIFTTNAGSSNGARYGTPRHVLVAHCVARSNGTTTGSLHPFNTHAEGWGIVFANCVAHVPYDPRNPSVANPTENTNIGFESRSRNTIFRDCHVFGSGETYGFLILADDCKIEHCSVDGGWRGIQVREESTGLTGSCNRAVIVHSRIHDLSGSDGGAGVILTNGSNHHVTHNDFYDVAGTAAYSGTEPACIHIGEGSGHRILTNTMNKVSNKYSIALTDGVTAAEVQITGNSMIGYTGVSGVTDSGINTSNSDSTAIQALCDAYNFTS